jgi:hypothetical protein
MEEEEGPPQKAPGKLKLPFRASQRNVFRASQGFPYSSDAETSSETLRNHAHTVLGQTPWDGGERVWQVRWWRAGPGVAGSHSGCINRD